jgi:hypothetical protein
MLQEAGQLLPKSERVLASLSQTPSDPVTTSLQLTVDSADEHLNGTYNDSNGVCDSSGTINLTKE